MVLDPFCGTGTTALVCAEQGIPCDTVDINPFLLWLTKVKTRAYSPSELDAFRELARVVSRAACARDSQPAWIPALHQIERWWDSDTLCALARAKEAIRGFDTGCPIATMDLLLVAFCRTLIECSNASFSHQYMSFRTPGNGSGTPSLLPPEDLVAVSVHSTVSSGDAPALGSGYGPGCVASSNCGIYVSWEQSAAEIAAAAASPIIAAPAVIHGDARELEQSLPLHRYTCVITSPPYPNRISYIRELRPYMYWLSYLRDGRAAGELDWKAIGGTWGRATSNVGRWQPPEPVSIPYDGFDCMIKEIEGHSPILSRYVHKYFYDIVLHCRSLRHIMADGGSLHYIVGNSKFFDVVVPVERIYARIFEALGFEDVGVRAVRKRNSKKELFEFIVSARLAIHDGVQGS
jgi:hypothetical protein